MVKTGKDETVLDAWGEWGLSTDHSLPCRGGENWNIRLEMEAFSSLKRISPSCF